MFVPEAQFRAPTEIERLLLERLLEANFPGRDELSPLVRNVFVRTVEEDGGLELQSQIEGQAHVNQRVPVEAEASKGDGGLVVVGDTIHMLLHVVDGRPVELEFYRDDGATVKTLPPPSAFELIVLPPRPENGWPNYGRTQSDVPKIADKNDISKVIVRSFLVSGCVGVFVGMALLELARMRMVSPTAILMLWPASLAGIADPSGAVDTLMLVLFEFGGNFILYGVAGTVIRLLVRLVLRR